MSIVWNGSCLEDGHEFADLDVHAWYTAAQRSGKEGIKQADLPSKYPLPGN